MTSRPLVGRGAAGLLLSAVIIELTAATAYIHFTLGGTLFLLNALGFVALALAYGVAAVVPLAVLRRFGWLPRLGLAGYTLLTIAAYLAIGPYFALGWVAKGIEVAIVGLIALDLLGIHGSPRGLLNSIASSLRAPWSREELQRG